MCVSLSSLPIYCMFDGWCVVRRWAEVGIGGISTSLVRKGRFVSFTLTDSKA